MNKLLLLLTLLGCVSEAPAPIPTPIVSPIQHIKDVSLSAAENDIGTKTYINDHWEITLPSSFKLSDNNIDTDTMIFLDPISHLSVGVNRNIVKPNTNTDTYVQALFQIFRDKQIMLLIDRHDHISIQGKGSQKDKEVNVVYFEAKENDNVSVAYCWVSGQAGYMIEVMGNEYNYDMAVQTLKDIQKTIKIAD